MLMMEILIGIILHKDIELASNVFSVTCFQDVNDGILEGILTVGPSMLIMLMLTLDLGYYCLPYIEMCSNLVYLPCHSAKSRQVISKQSSCCRTSECLDLQLECLPRL